MRQGGTVGSRTGTWSALLVFGALAFMLGGCGSLSPGLRTESAVLAARSQSTASVDSAAVPAQSDVQIMDEFSAAPEPAAFVSPRSIRLETMTSADAPSW